MTDEDTNNYEFTFYVFECNDPAITDCYVGSTRAFRERKRKHKSDCNNPPSHNYLSKVYTKIRDTGGWDHWQMRPIETKMCTRLEARIHETHLMQQRKATLNTNTAYTNRKEYQHSYYDKHREVSAIYHKKYYQENRTAILEQKKEYYQRKKQINPCIEQPQFSEVP